MRRLTDYIGVDGASNGPISVIDLSLVPSELIHIVVILKRRSALGPEAYTFGSTTGTYQPTIQTAWEMLKLAASGIEPRTGEEGVKWNQEQLRESISGGMT